MSTAAERIKAAAAATAATEQKIEAIRGVPADARAINSRGVYDDRHGVMNNLTAARYAIEAAINAIRGEWPSAADYKGDAS